MYAACDKCGKAVLCKADKKATNGSMLNHLCCHGETIRTLEQLVNDTKRTHRQATIQQVFQSSSDPLKMNSAEKKMLQKVMTVKFVANALLPLSIVKNESFRDLIQAYDPKARPMSTKMLQDQIILLEMNMKQYAISMAKGHNICLTIDHWTSKAKQNYTGLTAHFIDDDF